MSQKNSNKLIIDKPKEKCAVFGVSCNDIGFSVTRLLYKGLIALQHRGQESTGISVLKTGGNIYTYKRKGLVSKVLNNEKLSQYWGNVGIGHNRYATTGSEKYSSKNYIQPYHFKNNEIEFSLAFNGTIPNYDEIKINMEDMGRIFVTNTDTEVIAQLIASIALGTEDWPEILKMASKLLDGSYSLILLTSEGDIYAIRDPLGFKPLCIGEMKSDNRNLYFVASESCAIDSVGATFLRDVKPGEIVHLSHQKDIHSELVLKAEKTAICQFEFVYFARPDSIIDGVSVAEARLRMGVNLAKKDPILLDPEFKKDAIVVPVPDSGRSAAVGYAKEAKLPYVEGLMKNRYVWRTFIMPGQQKRKSAVKEKLNPIKSVVDGKEVILIDDSIVRGTTTKQIIALIKDAGAKSVNVRISCPPVVSACYMGIDFPTREELIAGRCLKEYGSQNFIDQIKNTIGADTLRYQTVEDLKEAIGIETGLCKACLTGRYPLKSVEKITELERSITSNRC
ncbi:MAG: amidophosphoribosyltransferase [Candidatus Lokiarchaeota archaeon]|nr:amidophosphoribosyltransferase [Candidatus Lokiarchaeota archaeon]MBD3202176.1 amidophosphoribosyltransferase [Candidatus Lokiarchaeota archaeon]